MTLWRALNQSNTNDVTSTSNDTAIILKTLRIYGSMYAASFLLYCYVRRRYNRYFNIRSWAEENRCILASREYGFFNWFWKCYDFSDDDILEHCGMDALCFLRALRFGRKMSILGTVNSIWLIPLYFTAESSPETGYIVDIWSKMSTSNLPTSSARFVGTVLAAYITFFYSMYLIYHEYKWYTHWRHKFLCLRIPRNYTVYVSGIPSIYRSSYALAEYFQQCSSKDAVLEAHVAMDIPNLETKVARRELVVRKLEHALAVERKYGVTETHRRYGFRRGVETVESVAAFENELRILNREIARSVREVSASNDKFRSRLQRTDASFDLLGDIDEHESLDSNDLAMHRLQTARRYNRMTPTSSSSSLKGGLAASIASLESVPENENDPFIPPVLPKLTELSGESDNFVEEIELKQLIVSAFKPAPESDSMAEINFEPQEIGKAPIDLSEGNHLSYAHWGSDDHHDPNVSDLHHDDDDLTDQDGDHEEKHSVDAKVDIEKPIPFVVHYVKSNSTGNMSMNVQEMTSTSEKSVGSPCSMRSFRSRAGDPSRFSGLRMSKLRTSITAATSQMADSIGSTIGSTGEKIAAGSLVVGSSIAKNSRRATKKATKSIARGSRAAATTIVKGSKVAGETVIKAAKDVNVEKVIHQASEKAHELGTHIVTSASAVVPMLLTKTEGKPRNAGFVVFTNLYTAQTALQMIHHPKPYVMECQEAPNPEHVFWRNVGLPARAKRTGRIMALGASAVLCFFWSVPTAFIASLTQLNSIQETIPKLADWIEAHPVTIPLVAQLAPLLLLIINQVVLPELLKEFATWEGHVSSAMLEASLFVKLGCFTIIQTFFVSALSGGVTAEITNMINNPGSIINFLANSLPAQSSYFVQILLASTFLLQSLELLRVYSLFVAFMRRFFGPRLTKKERKRTFGYFKPLDDPAEFWHAETFAQIILYFMAFYVYAAISPIICVFNVVCFIIIESGYRHQFIHNYPRAFETGGRLWKFFIQFTLASMIVAQLTLIGLLALKQSVYAGPAMGPLLGFTILFIVYINSRHVVVSMHLPSRECLLVDFRNKELGLTDMSFAKGLYLQPALQGKRVEPDYSCDAESESESETS